MVPEGLSPSCQGSAVVCRHDGRSELRAHLFKCKHEAEKTDWKLSKPTASDMLTPAKLHHPNLNRATNWGPSV